MQPTAVELVAKVNNPWYYELARNIKDGRRGGISSGSGFVNFYDRNCIIALTITTVNGNMLSFSTFTFHTKRGVLTLSVFYNNYVALCAKNKKSLSAVAEEIGLSRTSPNGWKKGKQPSDVNLQKLADYFGVSAAYLRGEEDQKEKSTNSQAGGLSKVDMEISKRLDQMSQEQKEKFLDFLIALLNKQEL